MTVLLADDPRHGTKNGYSNLNCRCSRCRRAWADYKRAYDTALCACGHMKSNRATECVRCRRAREEPMHGTESRYTRWRCRCEACKYASATARAARRQRRRERDAAKETPHDERRSE